MLPQSDNSEAYIQALAGVLQKARCDQFVIETIGKLEQRQIQQALGLGSQLVSSQAIFSAWQQQISPDIADLETVLLPITKPHRMSDRALARWLKSLRSVKQTLKQTVD